jgi:UDP-glucose 4-epimerase
MRLLVTGGAGYIGSVVSRQLLDAGHDVVVLDDLSTGHADAVPAGARLEVLSLHDSARLVTREAGFDAVLHFAAKALVGESGTHPERYWHTNVGGSLALLEAVRDAGVPRLVSPRRAPCTATRNGCRWTSGCRRGRRTRTAPRSSPST